MSVQQIHISCGLHVTDMHTTITQHCNSFFIQCSRDYNYKSPAYIIYIHI